jgi:2-hydroxycyclohexanecarboxyl-CoA dehydrogenase
MNRLAGKVALITGGGSGIGAATARLMCSEGAKVMLVDTNPEGLANTHKSIAERVRGASIGTFQADVSDATKARCSPECRAE